MHLSDLKALHVSQLLDMAAALEVDNAQRMRKQELMYAILKKKAKLGETIYGDGTLEILPDGFGFLRSPETSYMAIFRPRRFAASICIPATRLKAKSVFRRTVSAISHWCEWIR